MSERVQKMIQAINQEAIDRSKEIEEAANQSFKLQKYEIFEAGKSKITAEYKLKIENYIIQKRMYINNFREKSAVIN